MNFILSAVPSQPSEIGLAVRQNPFNFVKFNDNSPGQIFASCLILSDQAKSHTITKYECSTCHNRFKVKSDCIAHVKTHMPTNTRAACKLKSTQSFKVISFTCYRCPKCPALFQSKSALLHHCKTHLPVPQYHCRICLYQTNLVSDMVEHVYQHHSTQSNLL